MLPLLGLGRSILGEGPLFGSLKAQEQPTPGVVQKKGHHFTPLEAWCAGGGL